MGGKRGWEQELMMSLYKKETVYGSTAHTVNTTNFCSLIGYSDFGLDWPDDVINDQDTVHNSEYATDTEIVVKKTKFTYEEPYARPNSIIGLIGLAEGGVTSAQEGALVSYEHTIEEDAAGTDHPSINVIGKKGGKQYLIKGVMCNSWELSSEEFKGLKFGAELIGAGDRTVNASSFVAAISEPRLFAKHIALLQEEDTNISISAVLTQVGENISSATPTTLTTRLKSWNVKRTIGLEPEGGFGGGDYNTGQDYAQRGIEVGLTLRYDSGAELAYYESQTNLALEINCVHTSLVAATGANKFGFKLVIPRLRLTKAPLGEGGVKDKLTCTYNCIVLDDGTNNIFKFKGYNAKAAYLAA